MTGEAVNAATVAFKKPMIERALGAELSHRLGYLPGTAKPEAGTAKATLIKPVFFADQWLRRAQGRNLREFSGASPI